MTRAAVFSDIEGTLIKISFPFTYLEEARKMGFVPRANLWIMGVLSLLARLFSPKSRVGGILRYLHIMAGLRNVPVSINEAVMARVNPLLHAALKPEPLALIQSLHQQGLPVILISASLQPGAESFAATFGWRGEGTIPVIEQGRFTGRAEKPLTGEEKAVRVRAVAAEMQIDLAQSVGFGDTMGDVPFLSLLGKAYVVSPDNELRAIAIEKGWTILG
jgi:phosphoserine phosphatase